MSETSTAQGKHQPYGKNINRTSETSTAQGKHQPYERNINRTGKTSTAQGKHQPYGKNINRTSETSTAQVKMDGCRSSEYFVVISREMIEKGGVKYSTKPVVIDNSP
jgi:hypothetical protein